MYYNKINNKLKSYFNILSPEFPDWLNDYIDTPEMIRINNISMECGCDYTALFPNHEWQSNLNHSVGVALIIWNFTKDKKQTLAGLFHDIATPVFKHCIDFTNGDSEHQESTEEKTHDIIKNSKKIMELLERDGIKLEEVDDYKLYPIADNNSPQLSADRLEYNFSCGYFIHMEWTLDDLAECYNNLVITKNENGINELAFTNLEIANKYINTVSKLWGWWINDADRTSMQFIADVCRSLVNLGQLTIDELYILSESDVISRIKSCNELSEVFKKFENTKKCFRANSMVQNKYCVNVKGKRRYLNPLVLIDNKSKRIYDISKSAKKVIDEYMKIPIEGFTYFDFDFKPITSKR